MPDLCYLFAVFGDGDPQRVLAAGLRRADQRQDLPQGHAGHFPQHQHTSHPRHAVCDGAGLIEHHHTDLMHGDKAESRPYLPLKADLDPYQTNSRLQQFKSGIGSDVCRLTGMIKSLSQPKYYIYPFVDSLQPIQGPLLVPRLHFENCWCTELVMQMQTRPPAAPSVATWCHWLIRTETDWILQEAALRNRM